MPNPIEIGKVQKEDVFMQRRKLAKAVVRLIRQSRELEARLYRDEKTGLANDVFFKERMPQFIEASHKKKEPLALLIADVDGLKRTNDILGHQKGDQLLLAVAGAFKEVAREDDVMGRLGEGGDEFYAILPGFKTFGNQTEEELFKSVSQRYGAAFAEAIQELSLPEGLKIGVSFGIAKLKPGETAENLHLRADTLAIRNKKAAKAKLQREGVVFSDDRQ